MSGADEPVIITYKDGTQDVLHSLTQMLAEYAVLEAEADAFLAALPPGYFDSVQGDDIDPRAK